MRINLLKILLICFSFQAFACPDLSGEYLCTVFDYDYDIEIEESMVLQQSFGEMTIDNDTYKLDGKKHVVPFILGSYRAKCEGDRKITIQVSNLFGLKAFSSYIPTQEGFNILRTKSRRETPKVVSICKKSF